MEIKGFQVSFRRILRPYRWRILGLSVLMVVQSLLQVTMALLSRFVIDAALSSDGRLAFWGVALTANVLALVGVHAWVSWTANSTSDRLSARLKQDILRTAVFSRDDKLLKHHSGELLSRGVEDVYTVCDGAVNALPSLVGQVTRLAATFAAVLFIYPPVAGVLAVAAVAVYAATACLRPAIKARQRMVRKTDEKVMATMQEDLQQLELIQSLDAQEQVQDRFFLRIKENLRARFKRRIWSVGSNTLIHAASQIGSGVLLLWGASRVAAQAMTYGSLTAMLELLALFRGPVIGLSGLWTRLAGVEVAAERLQELLNITQPAEKLTNISDVKAIVFEDVTFAYPSDEHPVVENFNFRMPLDGWTCLTGISGKGKTTLFKLILGLYTPQAGRVFLETDTGEIPCSEATRHLFAYVPQDYALFSGTILENLQLVNPELSDPELRDALSVAQADFVWGFSGAEQTQVKENNSGLSKGQLQRLAIARAVLMDRPVFLLDECTSALDAGTEDAVLRNLRSLGKNAVVVTHRPEALADLPDVTSVSMEQ